MACEGDTRGERGRPRVAVSLVHRPPASGGSDELAELIATAGQQAVSPDPWLTHVVPDWPAVAAHDDGVHLSWGLHTAEGFGDWSDGIVTMLRYWMSERTLWLAEVFGEPEPLGSPVSPKGPSSRSASTSAARRASRGGSPRAEREVGSRVRGAFPSS